MNKPSGMNKPIKLFIISDNYPQFEAICSKYRDEIEQHKAERLTVPSQLLSYGKDEVEVWDVRILSVGCVKKGVEPFVME